MNATSEMLAAAERLINDPTSATTGFWSRAAAILTRQALELSLNRFLAEHAPGAQGASFTARLILLRILHPDPELAARIAYTWAALSRATHHQGYALPPTAPSLQTWLATTRTFTEQNASVPARPN